MALVARAMPIARRQQRGRRGRKYTEGNLGKSEHRRALREDEVAGERQLEPAAEAPAARDRGGHGREIEQRVNQRVHLRQHAVDLAWRMLGNAGAEAEVRPGAFDRDQLQVRTLRKRSSACDSAPSIAAVMMFPFG